MNKPRITVITVAYNSESTIAKAIESVERQDYDNFEYIIIDGGSTDATVPIIRKYEKEFRPHIKWVSEKDDGIYHAMNKGIALAQGDVLGFLNSDDAFAGDSVLQKIADAFIDRDVEAVYGDIEYFHEDNENAVIRRWRSSVFSPKMFINGSFPPHPSFYAKKSVYEKFGSYRTDLKFAADFELMMRFLLKHKVFSNYLPETFVRMRMGGVSNQNVKNIIKSVLECNKAFQMNGITSPFFIFRTLLFRFTQLTPR